MAIRTVVRTQPRRYSTMTKIPPEASYVEISKNTSQESVIGLIVGFIVILIVIAVVVLIFIRRRQLALCGSNAEKGKKRQSFLILSPL